MLRYWEENQIDENLVELVNDILNYSHLMEFFSSATDPSSSLDGKIVSSLINPGRRLFFTMAKLNLFVCVLLPI